MKKLLLVLLVVVSLVRCADECTECGEQIMVLRNNRNYIYYCNKDLDLVQYKSQCQCDCPEGEECATVTIDIEWPE